MALHFNLNTVTTFALVISIPALVLVVTIIVAIVRRTLGVFGTDPRANHDRRTET
jgi:hypothetical protein